jgi:hypothetical protein
MVSSEPDLWDYATAIYGDPLFGPRRVTRKRRVPENNGGDSAGQVTAKMKRDMTQ